MYKIFAIIVILAAANAAPADHQATSFSSFNDNHNSVHHIESAPASTYAKYAAPPTPAYVKYGAPSVYSVPAAPVYAAPAVAKVSLPVISKYAVPAAPVYHSAPVAKYTVPVYATPVTKVAVPAVAKYAAVPETKYAAAPSYYAPKEEYAPAQYEFSYVVEDPHTGDFHSQQEHRDGDHVVGQYSLHEADGTVRIVKYSDEGHGFNAVVERQGHPTEAPVYNKVVAVAPHYQH